MKDNKYAYGYNMRENYMKKNGNNCQMRENSFLRLNINRGTLNNDYNNVNNFICISVKPVNLLT